MEIHPPERPIHSWKDFLIQLMTITAGILIALSLEGILQWSHHRSLASEARENIRHELEDNQRGLAQVLADIPRLEKQYERSLESIRLLRADRRRTGLEVKIEYHLIELTSTSWSTAQATGALAYMDYTEVKKYAAVYDLQERVVRLQDRLMENVVAAFPSVDPAKATDRELDTWSERVSSALTYVKGVQALSASLRRAYPKALQ